MDGTCMDILLLFLVLSILFLIVIYLLILLFIQCLSVVLMRQSSVDGSLGRIVPRVIIPG
jgi:hypothetical protein